MQKVLSTILGCCAVMTLTGCPPSAPSVRDYIAAYSGYVQAATTKHTAECTVDPKTSVCATIKNAAAALNSGITARETWCGWSHTAPPDANAVCVPQKNAETLLRSALGNMKQFESDIKGAAK